MSPKCIVHQNIDIYQSMPILHQILLSFWYNRLSCRRLQRRQTFSKTTFCPHEILKQIYLRKLSIDLFLPISKLSLYWVLFQKVKGNQIIIFKIKFILIWKFNCLKQLKHNETFIYDETLTLLKLIYCHYLFWETSLYYISWFNFFTSHPYPALYFLRRWNWVKETLNQATSRLCRNETVKVYTRKHQKIYKLDKKMKTCLLTWTAALVELVLLLVYCNAINNLLQILWNLTLFIFVLLHLLSNFYS